METADTSQGLKECPKCGSRIGFHMILEVDESKKGFFAFKCATCGEEYDIRKKLD